MLVEAIRRFFRRCALPQRRLVAAVSGGVDSTALLIALIELRTDGWPLAAAHVNHHLRSAESDGDEAFVRELCEQLGIELHVLDGTLDTNAIRDRGIEAAAREIRFARLQEVRGDGYVATAHHRDDQAETILMRLLTGGGIGALRGIRAIREDGIIRPLLDVSRADIDAFLRERDITPRIDRSNADPRFLRNRVRAMLRDLPEASANLAAIAEQATAQWAILERAIDAAEDVETTNTETRFRTWPDDPWLRQALLHRHINRLDPTARDVSAADLTRLASQLDDLKRVSVTRELELIRRNDQLILRTRPEPAPRFEVDLEIGKPAHIPELNLTIHLLHSATLSAPAPQRPSAHQHIALPSEARHLTIRNRHPGDRFHPLGMSTDKKLKDFLIDRKIPAELRDSLPLVIFNGEIVWIAGVEVSERFKVTPATSDEELYEVWTEGPGASLDQTDLQR